MFNFLIKIKICIYKVNGWWAFFLRQDLKKCPMRVCSELRSLSGHSQGLKYFVLLGASDLDIGPVSPVNTFGV